MHTDQTKDGWFAGLLSKPALINWLCAGREIFPSLLEAIGAARESIQLETYIYSEGKLGGQFLAALTEASRRGVRVQVLVDAIGSWLLPDDFFHPLVATGAEVRRFNPIHPFRFGVRDHRKLLICDEAVVFIGGFNLSDEYDGDGVTAGWFDLGLQIHDSGLAAKLAGSFAELFALADFRKKGLAPVPRPEAPRPEHATTNGRAAPRTSRPRRQPLPNRPPPRSQPCARGAHYQPLFSAD